MDNNKKNNIYELAKLTGFSVSTVSKALNNTGRISQTTRELILEKAKEINYIANYNAKALSQRKSWIIAVIFSDNLGAGLSHPHFSVILDSFKIHVENAGYEVTFVNPKMGNTDMTYLEFCRYRRVEGVFVVNFYSLSKQIPELIESGMPLVTTDQGNPDITTITSDDYYGGQLATQYLIDNGHTKIYHIAGPLYTISAQNRLLGFQDIMEKNKLDYHLYEAVNYGYEDGYNAAVQMIEDADLPTAIFVASDWMALGALKAFKERNIQVPEDISVIGYDNLDFLQYSNPGLTTVAQDKRKIGEVAAKYLIDKISGENRESTLIDVTIIERETVKNIKK